MNTAPLDQLDCLSEGELWEIATSSQHLRSIRQAAMERWLFPSAYGYTWARERIQTLKRQWEAQYGPIQALIYRRL